MNPHPYVRLRHPWEVAVDVAHPGPARMLARLLDETIRNRIPVYGPTAPLRNLFARGHLPRGAAAAAIRRWPSKRDAGLESLRMELGANAILVLERRRCRTVFMFEADGEPVSVAKLPRAGDPSAEREYALLGRLAGISIAPRPLERRVLSSHGEAFLQEMVVGQPLRVEGVRSSEPRSLEWDPGLASACSALTRLAGHTAGPLDETDLAPAAEALHDHALSPRARRKIESSLEHLGTRGALRHGDTSPQNVLIEGDELTAMVDWELAKDGGAPGFDVLNLALASLEQAMALRRLTPRSMVEAFAESWTPAPFWSEARRCADDAAEAAGTTDGYREHLVTLFFARRLGRRLAGGHHPAARDMARAALEVVCGR